MSEIINGVASEYDMPMKYENKKMTIFIDTQDMEERYGEELYKEYLENENKQLKQEKADLIKWLESKNQFHYKNGKIEDNYILVSEVLNKVRGVE